MSSLDKVDSIFYLIQKYILPVAFLIAGIVLLKMAVVPERVELNNGTVLAVDQSKLFLYSALIFIVVSVVWLLYLLNMIKSMVGYIIMVAMLIGSAVILYLDYATVQEEVKFNNMYAERDIEIKTRIMDIKAAEVAYKEVHGTYTNSMDDLINFVKTGTKMDFYKEGSIPERKITPEERDVIYGDDRPIDKLMTEVEAAILAKKNGNKILDENGKWENFRRDTNYVPVMDAIFNSERYLDNRSKIGGTIPFKAEDMRYVPFTEDLTQLDTASIFKGEIRVPTLMISMTHPMEHPTDGFKVYTVGSIDDNHLRDNWSK
ncbi:MAG: hypothetical protein R2780_14365 [Crocinitomicaceae bacterium]|nr:hypothetical protein [Crocinitomicaceae bacterium]